MSVPRERLDQLLSGYLDDVLSDDEKTQVETLLRDDPDVARELDELRQLRGSLRDISRTDSSVRLDDGFADRVLGAAAVQAQAEGVSDSHPLIKLSEQPSTTGNRQIPWLRIAGGIVAVAASIAVAIVAFQPDDDIGLNIAKLDPPNETMEIASNIPSVDVPDPVDTDATNSDPIDTPSVKDTQPTIAMNDTSSSSAPDKPSIPNELNPVESNASAANPDSANPMVAVAPKTSSQPDSAEPNEAGSGSRANLFVINIKRTDAGRQARVVREAMKLASIKPAEEKELTNKMVGFVGKTLEDKGQADEAVKVIFLEASMKRIDVLVNRLLADQEIESLGFSMSVSAPVRRVAESLQTPHPTTVNHGTTWDLQGEALAAIADELDNQVLLPMKGIKGLSVTMPTNTDGPDELSQVLMLIR